MIELDGVQKVYDGRIVLDIPRLTIEERARYALVGPNGSGKSTLLRILAGTVKPDAGTVAMDVLPADVGYLPQTPYAFDQTVIRNVMLGLHGVKDGRAKALAALRQVGLEGLAYARGNRLSGGESQRMAFSRMIAKPRGLLLLDEPTSAADILAEEQIESALLHYTEDGGCTLVFSTHAPGQALRLATHAIVLFEGRVVEIGEAEAVLRNPQSPQTKRFLERWIVPAR